MSGEEKAGGIFVSTAGDSNSFCVTRAPAARLQHCSVAEGRGGEEGERGRKWKEKHSSPGWHFNIERL